MGEPVQAGSVTHYFVESAALYGAESGHGGLYGDASGDYADNHIRFCRAGAGGALEISRVLFHADVFHCHDWQASLLPVYLRAILSAGIRIWRGPERC